MVAEPRNFILYFKLVSRNVEIQFFPAATCVFFATIGQILGLFLPGVGVTRGGKRQAFHLGRALGGPFFTPNYCVLYFQF